MGLVTIYLKDKDVLTLKPGVSIIPTYGFGDNITKDKDLGLAQTLFCCFQHALAHITVLDKHNFSAKIGKYFITHQF